MTCASLQCVQPASTIALDDFGRAHLSCVHHVRTGAFRGAGLETDAELPLEWLVEWLKAEVQRAWRLRREAEVLAERLAASVARQEGIRERVEGVG